MVGQKVASAKIEQTINETHDATLVELAELKVISAEIQQVIKDLEEKVK
jgi:hypothetical protein